MWDPGGGGRRLIYDYHPSLSVLVRGFESMVMASMLAEDTAPSGEGGSASRDQSRSV